MKIIKRAMAVIAVLCCFAMAASPIAAAGSAQDLPSLKDLYRDHFLIGMAGGVNELSGDRLALVTRHFNAFTFENAMKPAYTQPAEGTFTLGEVNSIIAALKASGMNIVGHTLAWHEQSPAWLWSDAGLAKARLEAHIEGVLRGAGEDLLSIDVVNEAFKSSPGRGRWREEMHGQGWYSVLGADFVEIAFRKAGEVREAMGRPGLKLYYNDYNLNNRDKASRVYEMVTELRGKGVPIDGIGMQGHYSLDGVKPGDVARSLALFATIPGIEVSITELDIAVGSAKGADGLTAAEDWLQASLYARLFAVCKQYAKGPANPDPGKRIIARVTFWGLTDDTSWRGDRYPLLFDRERQPKGAFFAAADPEGTIQRMGCRADMTFTVLLALCGARGWIRENIPWAGDCLANAIERLICVIPLP